MIPVSFRSSRNSIEIDSLVLQFNVKSGVFQFLRDVVGGVFVDEPDTVFRVPLSLRCAVIEAGHYVLNGEWAIDAAVFVFERQPGPCFNDDFVLVLLFGYHLVV